MTNSLMLGGVYILMAIMLLLGTLMSRREKPARMLTMMLAWISIFGGGFVLFTFRDDLGYVAQRLRSEATGEPVTAGREVRIPMAIDGHFWVDARLNGQKIKFLVDSGNGVIRVATGHADTLEVGPIKRRQMNVHIAGTDADLNVLGMNFLSSLQRWGVEGRWLILVP